MKNNFFIGLLIGLLIAISAWNIYKLIIRKTTDQNPTNFQTGASLASTPTASGLDLADWVSFDNILAFHTLKHPAGWQFLVDKPLSTIFNNMPSQQNTNTRSGKISGKLTALVSSESLCGIDCKNLTEEQFFSPDSSFRKTGNLGGGGSGLTRDSVYETKIANRRTLVTLSHPASEYEFAAPYQMTRSYYLYIGSPNAEIFKIEVTYDKDKTPTNELNTLDQVLNTLVLTF